MRAGVSTLNRSAAPLDGRNACLGQVTCMPILDQVLHVDTSEGWDNQCDLRARLACAAQPAYIGQDAVSRCC